MLPIVSAVTVPTPLLESRILQQLPDGGAETSLPARLLPGAAPYSIPFYRQLFSLMKVPASGVPVPVLGCPFTSGGSPAGGSPANGDGCAAEAFGVAVERRMPRAVCRRRAPDYNAGANDILWVRLQADTGLQAAYFDPINPVFDAGSRRSRSIPSPRATHTSFRRIW